MDILLSLRICLLPFFFCFQHFLTRSNYRIPLVIRIIRRLDPHRLELFPNFKQRQ
jgi:hypothetical protein